MSSAATCLVAGVEYSHGQQIYSKDPCEFCLCLDGEMFCWWQDCPPTLEGPCRDRLPYSPCANGPHDITSTNKSKKPSEIRTTTILDTDTTSTEFAEYFEQNVTGTQEFKMVTSQLQTASDKCVIMGKEYIMGETLPHDTGNCVECICGAGGQVTCSPHQCSPPGDEINDYRQPGSRPQFTETF